MGMDYSLKTRQLQKRKSILRGISDEQLTAKQKQYCVYIITRNYENNFYLNNIDQSIAFVIPYKYKFSFLMIIFLGIPYIISKISNRKLAELRGEPCLVREADFYLIIDEIGNYHICPFERKFIDPPSSLKSKKSIVLQFSNIKFESSSNEYHVVSYDYNQYFCYEHKNKKTPLNNSKNDNFIFISPNFTLNNYNNKEIYKAVLHSHLNNEDILFQRRIYGPNQLSLKSLNFCTILLGQFKQFFFVYPLPAVALWIYEGYIFYIVILFAFIFILIFTSYQKFLNKKAIIDFSLKKEDKITLIDENGSEHYIDYESLVPGQLIKIREEDIIPCDCLLLEGYCSVIESTLTGESTSVMKYRLQSSETLFNYNDNKKSVLFSGTKVEIASPKELLVLVIGTGFNTQRGNLIQSVLFPKKSNFNFYRENITFFIFIIVILLIATAFFIYFYIINEERSSIWTLLLEICDILFIVLPPTLSISLTVGTFYYQYSLNQKKIRCSDEYRLIASGRVNKIILDKTGTLTKEELELYGYRGIIKKENEIQFDSLETDTKLYLSFLSEYYKKQFMRNCKNEVILNEEEEEDNTMAYFLECLATCHSIAEIGGEFKGNNIDMKIFDNIKWQFEKISEGNSSKVNNDQYEMKPKKYYQITEDQYFFKGGKHYTGEGNSYGLKVIQRYPFDSRHQSMSVIALNKFNKTMHFFIKGAPEKIKAKCKDCTLPNNFDNVHRKYTLQGFRVLACATKKIEGDEKTILNQEKNFKSYESDLVFLGFIIFQNRLKKKTKEVFQKLAYEGLIPIISTGDNAFTSISVVKECNLIKDDGDYCIIDTDSEQKEEINDSMQKDSKEGKLKFLRGGNIVLRCSFKEKKNKKNQFKDYEVEYRKLWEFNTKVKRLTVKQLNDMLKRDPEMKLCIHSRVFDIIFLRDCFGFEKNNDAELSKNIKRHEYLEKQANDIAKLRQIIVDKAVLFFRMSPSDKSKLVQLYKKENPSNIVCMCGDGANDCSALITADVGISLKSSENTVMTAHLMANTKSISVVNDIIIIGRTCFENSSILLKILLLYAEMASTVRIILEYKGDDMTNNQYIFIDCMIVFCGCCLISISDPNFKIRGRQLPKSILFNQFLFSVLGHSIFQVGLFVIYFFLILNKDDNYISIVTNEDLDSNELTYYNSYCFILLSFQCLSFVFIFNYFSTQKESTFKNRILTIYLILVTLILTEVLSINVYKVGMFNWELAKFVPTEKGENFSQKSRIILLGFCVSAFLLAWLWETVIYYFFVDRTAVIGGMIKRKEEYEMVSDDEMVEGDNTFIPSENKNKLVLGE